MSSPCCAPSSSAGADAHRQPVPAGATALGLSPVAPAEPAPAAPSAAAAPRSSRSTRGQVAIPGGTFTMGDAFGEGYPQDGEGPAHRVRVSPFHIDATTVTNAQFATPLMASARRTGRPGG